MLFCGTKNVSQSLQAYPSMPVRHPKDQRQSDLRDLSRTQNVFARLRQLRCIRAHSRPRLNSHSLRSTLISSMLQHHDSTYHLIPHRYDANPRKLINHNYQMKPSAHSSYSNYTSNQPVSINLSQIISSDQASISTKSPNPSPNKTHLNLTISQIPIRKLLITLISPTRRTPRARALILTHITRLDSAAVTAYASPGDIFAFRTGGGEGGWHWGCEIDGLMGWFGGRVGWRGREDGE